MRLLFISYVWPEPKSSAAGVRDQALIEIFRDAGYDVTFASPAKENDAKRELERQGFRTLPILANDSSFDEQVARLGPDVVVFGRFIFEEQFSWRVRQACPEALRVLDTVDLHFLRKARGEWVRAGIPLGEVFTRVPSALGDDGLLRELAAIHRSDLTLLCSDFERDLLVREYGMSAGSLELAPFFYPEPYLVSDFSAREGFVAVGNFRHEPNLDAAFWLKRDLWPRIRAELPTARVELIGAYPPREAMALHAPGEGFVVRGSESAEIHEILANFRVNLAPLRFGAGIKGKIAEGWRVGTPAVSTPIGAEGMRGIDGSFGGLVGTSAPELAEQALRLYHGEKEWREASGRGLSIVRGRFARAQTGSTVLAAIARARAPGELHARRGRSIVGLMLWQQGNRATEYFSRWIEAKNRPLDVAALPAIATREAAAIKETETEASQP